MSDPHEEPTAKHSIEQPVVPNLEDLKGVLGWVQKKKDESKSEGKPWGWVMGLIAAIVVFIALAFAAYTAWKKGRQIAKLKHKIDVDEEKKKQAEADATIARIEKDAATLRAEATKLEAEIANTKNEIKSLENDRILINKKIDVITNWEDIDNL